MSQNNNHSADVPRTGHIYDGIEELDHAAPRWFVGLFYISILFALGYSYYYFIGEGPTLLQEYQKERDEDTYSQYVKNGANPSGPKMPTEDEMKGFLNDPAKKTVGSAVYQARCVSCHGVQGQGGVGPNLTDNYWIHGAKMTEMVTVINNGILDKGMPPWGPILKPEEVQAVAVHVRTLLGTNPADAKAPQGVLVKIE